MKYIITIYGEVIIGNVGHYELRQSSNSEIKSAGHCKIENGKIKVWGKSATYDIPSQEEDAKIIEELLTI